MNQFDSRVKMEPLAAKDIKKIREHVHISQPVFARYLNTSESTVQKWESRQKRRNLGLL